MALNPIVYTDRIVQSFLRYQLTTYPFADPGLHEQMRSLLSLGETRRSPLLRGPYISLSRPFRRGAHLRELAEEGVLHPLLAERVPEDRRRLFGHQEEAIRAICSGRPTLVSTGTGSGKTECFLYPIISTCLRPHHGVWRCQSCSRRTPRRTPKDKCMAWRCDGTIEFVREDPDDYNLQLIDQRYSMLRPEEHTAMVPHDERERLENLFKGDSEAVNCFVCTPTLELGVDIGQLDAVLMRNVPPLPANYWQRVGRAGRRHRMAVDFTYCRPVSHDRAYFAEPEKLLSGRVDPPAFNLRNDVEEDVRFQMGVAIYGLERDHHEGGAAYRWGGQPVHLRRGVRLRLVNVGASSAVEGQGRLGYPVCLVCGQSVSPLSSRRTREKFEEDHAERCGRPPRPVGFYADVVADMLTLTECPNRTAAFSVLEALRIAATRVLDMHLEDLQILVIGQVDRDEVDAHLWDPMPGGSGLLDQLCERFGEIVEIATDVVSNCPSACQHSCIDCLQTFRNSYYHRHLDRKIAAELLRSWGPRLAFSHEIQPHKPEPGPREGTYPVNEAERRLRHLLRAAGFGEGIRGEQIRLDRTLGTTTPDVIFRGEDHDPDEGVCIYLDGLSAHLHGNPETAERDRQIRSWLRHHGYEVLEIPYTDLGDEEAMVRHFRRLARYLGARDLGGRLRGDRSWFRSKGEGAREPSALRLVEPGPDQRFVTCVPLVPLEAAAGAFGDPQHLGDETEWQWVELDPSLRPRRGMFVSKVVGRSMEPKIRDGSYCLFRSPVEGSRQGRIVLVQLQDSVDPETGSRYTVKRYRSAKEATPDGTWRHVRITLEPLNPDFEPIELVSDDEGSVTVIAEFVAVIGETLVDD